jgi:hypothetical protein
MPVIGTPLVDIPVHIVQTKGIKRKTTHFSSLPPMNAFWSPSISPTVSRSKSFPGVSSVGRFSQKN